MSNKPYSLNVQLGPLFTLKCENNSGPKGQGNQFSLAPCPPSQVVQIVVGAKTSSLFSEAAVETESSYKGFVQYKNTGWSQTIPANVRTKVEFGPTMVQTVNNLSPTLIGHEFFADDEMKPFGTQPFGKYRLRMNFTGISPIIGTNIRLELDIDGIFDTIDGDTYQMIENSGTPENISATFDFYTGSVAIANGGEIYVTASNPLTLSDGLILVIVEDV